jgi:type IV secretion system protein VirD4
VAEEHRTNRADNELTAGEVGWLLGGLLTLACLSWVVPVSVVLMRSGHLPRLGVVSAAGAAIRLVADGLWSDPCRAYPTEVRDLMPAGLVWWAFAGPVLVITVVLGRVCWRRLEPAISKEMLGRRPYDIRGSRPRAWGRGRDVGRGAGFRLGRLDGGMVRADEEAHVVVIAPTRSGKTTRCIIPWLFEHRGPAIVTSTKRDVLDATAAHRGRIGQVWVYDPFESESASWSPLHGCAAWSYAMRQAQWLADATEEGASEIARYWRGEAAKLLAPLLHAAAIEGLSIAHVLAWVDVQETRQPCRVLLAAGAVDAERQLQAVATLDGRNKGTTYMSAGSVLHAFRFPEVLGARGPAVTPRRFFDGAPNTLYVVAPERHQQILAPLIVGLLSSLVHAQIERGSPGPRTRLLLDEAANIAPLSDLPRLLSQAAGHGIRVATIWQSLAQMNARYGDEADTILANSSAKLFMGPITDHATRTYITELLGSGDNSRPKTSAAALQQLGPGRALLVNASDQPAILSQRPWWKERRRW